MFNITNQRNANKNQNEMSPHICQNGYHQKTTNNMYWWGCKEKLVGMYIGMATIKTVLQFLKKWKIELPCDPSIPLLHIYPKKIMIPIQKDICTMLNTALFTIAKTEAPCHH